MSFTDALVVQHWAVNWPGASCQLAVEDMLWQVAVFHEPIVAEPMQASLGDHCEHVWNAFMLKDDLVRHAVLP